MEGIDKNLPSFESLGLAKNKPLEKQRLSQEDFMELMMAQIKHQDPMKPLDNGEFIGQMAQFSSVQGLKELKDSFSLLANAMQSSQALQASSMVGRKVLVPGNMAQLPEGGELRGAVEVLEETQSVVIKFLDNKGQTIHTMDLGKRGIGTATFKWDGVISKADATIPDSQDEKAEPGEYKVIAEVLSEGKPQAIETFVVDSVDSVSLTKGGHGVTLNLNKAGATSLANVREIL